MRFRDRLLTAGVRTMVRALVFALLHLPRRLVAFKFRALAWLVWIATGDPEAAKPIREVAGIFASGPPHTVRLEKLLRNMEPEFVADAARCLSRRSPYGAP